jgi:hypothetical protein
MYDDLLVSMGAPVISDADMLEIQLRKWIRRGHVHNVTLRPTYSHPSVPVGEIVVAEVLDRAGRGLFFTSSGLTLPERGFIRYADVLTATWISSGPDRIAHKREDFDQIELSFHDGSSAMLADLGQAVFPLFQFFQWMIARRQNTV